MTMKGEHVAGTISTLLMKEQNPSTTLDSKAISMTAIIDGASVGTTRELK